MSNNSLYSENLSPPPTPPPPSPTTSQDIEPHLIRTFSEELSSPRHQNHPGQASFEDIPLRDVSINRLLSRNGSPISQSRSLNSAHNTHPSPISQSQGTTTLIPSPSPPPKITPAGRSRSYPIPPNLNKPLPIPPRAYFSPSNTQCQPAFYRRQRSEQTLEQIRENPYGTSHLRSQTVRNGIVERQTVFESLRWFWQRHSWKVMGFFTGFAVAVLVVVVFDLERRRRQEKGNSSDNKGCGVGGNRTES